VSFSASELQAARRGQGSRPPRLHHTFATVAQSRIELFFQIFTREPLPAAALSSRRADDPPIKRTACPSHLNCARQAGLSLATFFSMQAVMRRTLGT
jgi:hypothetical protein